MPGVEDDDRVAGANGRIGDQMSLECGQDVGACGVSVGYELDMRFWDTEELCQKIFQVIGVIDGTLQAGEHFVLEIVYREIE
jgi:hypothetical protein